MNIEQDILPRLVKVKKSGKGWTACCPAHDDKNPSLSINTGQDGKVLLKCQSHGCTFDQICAALNATPAQMFPERNGHHVKSEIVAEYDYVDESGKLLFQVCRKIPKSFPQRQPDGKGGWIWGLNGVRKVLYRLPDVIAARTNGETIIITEGEKDVQALEKAGFTATCNPCGAGKWLDEYSETLRGADVVLCGDNDAPGEDHVLLVASKLIGKAKSVRTIKLPRGKDAHEFFEKDGTAEEIRKLIEAAPIDRPPKTLAEETEDRRFNPALNPPPVQPVYSIAGSPACTRGNISGVYALVKAGKSGFMGAFLSSTFAIGGSDTLSVTSSNPDSRAVLHFDTEQSIEDHWHQVSRAMRRGGREMLPEWVLSYCLTGFDAKKARKAIWQRVETAAQEHGGIHSILIDGVADLVCDVNDAEECNEYVASLHALAIQYDCPIIGVLHFNPGSEKTRGHLGSQLERKAETNLRLDKDGEVTEVWSEKQRRSPIFRGKGPRFQWSNEAGMHVSVERGASAKETAKRQDAINLRDDVFRGRPSMRYSELEEAIRETTKKSDGGAKNIFREWGKLGIIAKSFGGQWTPTA